MHLRVFLCVNLFRLRSRRTGDIRCLKTWEPHRLHTLMIFDDGTHSKRRPQHYTLDFHKSPSVGEDVKNPKSSMHKNDDDDVSSILLLKREKKKRAKNDKKRKEKMIYIKEKKKKRSHKKGAPLLYLCHKAQGLYTLLVCSLALLITWSRTIYNQAIV